ncbi:hypothetical protein [Halomicrococcus sp. NG-SE-24]|uniref:hypothetical protein n=1 Tax=Halomicrococcus sp. NG-SE-24 TaxID=3436928 RepID=UPI003D97A826
MDESREEFVDELRSRVGPALRGVTIYDDGEYRSLYDRDDVEGRYESADLRRLHRESLLGDGAREDAEHVLRTGRLNVAIYAFDQAVLLQFPAEPGALFVHFDDEAVPLLAVVEQCSEWLER